MQRAHNGDMMLTPERVPGFAQRLRRERKVAKRNAIRRGISALAPAARKNNPPVLCRAAPRAQNYISIAGVNETIGRNAQRIVRNGICQTKRLNREFAVLEYAARR